MRIDDQLTVSGNGGAYRATPLRDLRTQAARLDVAMKTLAASERLKLLRREVDGRIVFTTGFGIDGQVIFHLIAEHNLEIDVVTIDTGRLFAETHKLWNETERRYVRRIQAVFPRENAVSDFIDAHGVDGFYESKDARMSCCFVRKVEPLKRALAGAAGWVTGLRGEQSVHRSGAGFASAELGHRLVKANPLFDWTRDQVLDFARKNNVPVNSLHARGYASIGCAPCTRAIRPGEPERAGRWWWENSDRTECGLHTLPAPNKTVPKPAPQAVHSPAGC